MTAMVVCDNRTVKETRRLMSMRTPVLGLLIAAALAAVPLPARAQSPTQITIAIP
jgi:hypothetical protein